MASLIIKIPMLWEGQRTHNTTLKRRSTIFEVLYPSPDTQVRRSATFSCEGTRVISSFSSYYFTISFTVLTRLQMSISLEGWVFNLALPDSASDIQWKTVRESVFICKTSIPSTEPNADLLSERQSQLRLYAFLQVLMNTCSADITCSFTNISLTL